MILPDLNTRILLVNLVIVNLWDINIINLSLNNSLNCLYIFISERKSNAAVGSSRIIIGVFLTLNKSTRKHGVIMLTSLAIGSIIGNGLLKNIFERQRPFVELSLQPFIVAPSGFSFPSGHSLSSFASATCIFFTNKKWGIFSYIVAFLIALSRVLLIVHYPSDVIIGSLLGIIISSIVIWIFKKIRYI